MTEIRVACAVPDKHHRNGQPIDGWHWHPDSPANREMLRVIVESGNEIFGAGTHWVEVRVG